MKYSTNSITVHKTESESVQYDNSVFEKLSEDELLKLKTKILQNIASLENVENAFENVLKNENEKYTTDSPNLNTSSHHDTAILTKNDVNLEPVDNIPENPHIFTHKNNKDIPKKQNSSRNKICEIAKMKKYICERIKKYGLYFECPYCDLKRFWKLNDVNVHLKCVHDIVSKTGRKIIRKKCIYKQIEMFRDARKKVLNLPVISQADNIKDNQVISYAHQDLQKTNAFLADISSEKIDNEEQIDIEDKRYANKDLHKMNDFPLVDLTAEKVNTSNKSYADEDVHKQNDFLSVHWTDKNIYSENIIDVHKINNFPVVKVTAKKIDIEEKIDTEGTPIISNPSTNLHILDASLVVDLVPDNANIKNGTEAESPQTSPDNIISIHEITKKAISQINDIINTINNSSLNAEQEKIKNLESTELSPNAKNLITEQTYSANNIKEILINKDDSLLNILNECGLQDYKIVDKTDMDAQILEIPIEMVALTKEKFSKEENGREAEHPLTSPDDINRAHENTKKAIIQETEIENNTINNSSLNTEQEHIRNVEATELSPDAIHLTNEKSYSAYINKKSLINKDDSLINILNDCGLQDYKIVDKIDMDSQMLEIPIEMVDLSEEKFCKKKNGTEAENPLTNPDNIISTHENTKKLIIQETDIKNNTYNNSSLNAEPEQNKNVEVTELSSDAINFSTEQTYSATINKKNLIYKDDSLLNVLNECGLQAYQIVDKIDIDVQALEVPIELVNLTEKTISKEQNVIEAENPFTSPDDIISNHENPEKIIIQETVEENKMINNYSLSAVQEFVKNAETTELSAVALTIEQTNSASINTGSLINKDDSLLNISYECALQNYEIVDEVDNSVVDEVDNGIVDEVDMDIVNEVDKEVLDEVDMEVVDEIDMDVQIIEVPIEIVDLTEETFFEEINGTEAGKTVTTLDNINCNKKVIQGPMTINNDTINLINTNQNYCNVITIGNIDLTKGPTNFAQINKENLKKKNNGKNKSNKIQLQTVTKEKKITYGCKLCRKKTFKKKLFALQHITCKHVESNAYSLLVENNKQNKQIDKEFSKINHNKQENNLKANLIDVNAVKNNDRNKKNINNAKNTTHNTQVKNNTSIDKKMIQVKDLLNKVGITNKSKTKITKKTLLNIPTYVFGCCLCPHTTFFSAIEILEHNRLVHSGSAALKTAMPIVPITKLFERSDSSKTKLFLSCLCNYITFDKNFLETEIINKEYKNILMKKNRTHIFSNLACDAESKIIKIYKDEFMYHNRYEVIIDPKANSKKRKPQEDANETDKVVKKRCMDTLSKACNNGLDSVLPVHNSTVSSLPDIVPLVENEISTSSSVLTQQNKKNEKPSLSMYKYTPPTLVGKWGKKQSPTFPKFDWYFWPFEEQ